MIPSYLLFLSLTALYHFCGSADDAGRCTNNGNDLNSKKRLKRKGECSFKDATVIYLKVDYYVVACLFIGAICTYHH